MKTTTCLFRPADLGRLFVILALLFVFTSGRAQTSTSIPVVTIQATDPLASWAGDTGTFTVFRSGDPTWALNLFYRISGTASNGVDYQTIGNYVQIPAGAYSNTITIAPIDLGQTAIETVKLQLAYPPTLPPINYTIGSPSAATVFITPPGVTNVPPLVNLVLPTGGSMFYTPTNISLIALASDPDGSVASVEFFAGTNSLGVVTMGVVVDPGPNGPPPPGTRAFFLTWSNPPLGSFALTAKATDNDGAATVSDPVKISVLQGPPPNVPPRVSIATPPDGAMFYAPVDIPICAAATDPDGYVATVEFFAGTNSLGVRTNNPMSAGPLNPFCLIWSNVPPGAYVLTAKATDDGGAMSTSGPVNILVQPAPTNFPPVVRITSPPNGAVFRTPVDIPIYAFAADRDGFVSNVEFFAGTNDLGPGHGVCLSPIAVTPPVPCPTNVFVLVWSNAPVGTFALTAVAADNVGATTVSPPVNITVLPSPPPPTNRPPLVSILAIDPIAIEGTNCWPWLGLAGVAPTWSNWTASSAVCRFFTNCGPKNATFAVNRLGATNEDLMVSYAIGGSASNGVDYVTLPGVVTVPAGERRALVTVVPLDDGPPDINSTVILKLTPGTNYVIGYPPKAAALILDAGRPTPGPTVLPDKCFHLCAAGPDGAWFHVEFSSDLLNWTSICTNQVVNGSIDFVDPDAQSAQVRFYRAVPEPNPPAN